jgi:hypothetical protein
MIFKVRLFQPSNLPQPTMNNTSNYLFCSQGTLYSEKLGVIKVSQPKENCLFDVSSDGKIYIECYQAQKSAQKEESSGACPRLAYNFDLFALKESSGTAALPIPVKSLTICYGSKITSIKLTMNLLYTSCGDHVFVVDLNTSKRMEIGRIGEIDVAHDGKIAFSGTSRKTKEPCKKYIDTKGDVKELDYCDDSSKHYDGSYYTKCSRTIVRTPVNGGPSAALVNSKFEVDHFVGNKDAIIVTSKSGQIQLIESKTQKRCDSGLQINLKGSCIKGNKVILWGSNILYYSPEMDQFDVCIQEFDLATLTVSPPEDINFNTTSSATLLMF